MSSFRKFCSFHASKIQLFFGFSSFALPFFLYLESLFPTWNWPESSKIVAGANALDVTNSPPNILSWILGWIWLRIFPNQPSIQLSVLNAILGAAGSTIFFLVLRGTTKKIRPESLFWTGLIPLLFSFWFSTTPSYWASAIAPSHLPLTLLLFHLGIFYFLKSQSTFSPALKPFLGSVLFFCLAATNHLPTMRISLIIIALGLASNYLFYGGKVFSLAALSIVIGCSPLIYLPLHHGTFFKSNIGIVSSIKNVFWFLNSPLPQNEIRLSSEYSNIFSEPSGIILTAIACFLSLWLIWSTKKNHQTFKFISPWVVLFFGSSAALLLPNFWGSGSSANNWAALLQSAVVCLACIQTTNLFEQLSPQTKKTNRTNKKIGWRIILIVFATSIWLPQTIAQHKKFSWAWASASSVTQIGHTIFSDLPKNAIILSQRVDTTSLYWAFRSTQKHENNQIIIPTFLLKRPNFIEHLLLFHPELANFLQHYLMEDEISLEKLSTLVAERPVFVELLTENAMRGIEKFHPTKSLFFQYSGTSLTNDDMTFGAKDNLAVWKKSIQSLGQEIQNPFTKHWLTSTLVHQITFYDAQNRPELSRPMVEIGLSIDPNFTKKQKDNITTK